MKRKLHNHVHAHTPRSGSRPRQRPCPSTPTYQPPYPWFESSKAMASVFSSVENTTFKQEDIVDVAPTLAVKEKQPVTMKPVELKCYWSSTK